MENLRFSYKETSRIDFQTLSLIGKKLLPKIQELQTITQKHDYADDAASINLPSDQGLIQQSLALAHHKKLLKPSLLIVIGIGGSNLGTIAVHQALQGMLYNEQNPSLKVFFADTVDPDKIFTLATLMENELKAGGVVLLNVVTKSGTTLETIANFELLLEVLCKYCPENYHEYIVITTDEGSKLWNYARAKKIDTLPCKVGGRFSVLSAVGIFPLALLGIDTQSLCTGAIAMRNRCLSADLEENDAALSAGLIYAHYLQGIKVHDMFVFSGDLQGLAFWYRQLLGESIGKERDLQGKKINSGILPTVSVGSTDLHSVAELYFGGPHMNFTTFITVDHPHHDPHLLANDEFEQIVPHIQGKSLSVLLNSIAQGTKSAYLERENPFAAIEFPEKSPFVIGQFLQFKMIEIMYLGFLLNINPFIQPSVELYKKEVKKNLG